MLYNIIVKGIFCENDSHHVIKTTRGEQRCLREPRFPLPDTMSYAVWVLNVPNEVLTCTSLNRTGATTGRGESRLKFVTTGQNSEFSSCEILRFTARAYSVLS